MRVFRYSGETRLSLGTQMRHMRIIRDAGETEVRHMRVVRHAGDTHEGDQTN